jgi:hypothetical protein
LAGQVAFAKLRFEKLLLYFGGVYSFAPVVFVPVVIVVDTS